MGKVLEVMNCPFAGGCVCVCLGEDWQAHSDISINRNETKLLPSSHRETYDPSFWIICFNKCIGIKLDIPFFKEGVLMSVTLFLQGSSL